MYLTEERLHMTRVKTSDVFWRIDFSAWQQLTVIAIAFHSDWCETDFEWNHCIKSSIWEKNERKRVLHSLGAIFVSHWKQTPR